MENRQQKIHRERLADSLREEIGAILEGELADPRIGVVSVSEVVMSPDGRSVRVFVVTAGDEDQALKSMEGLDAARAYIRHEVGMRLSLRHPPEVFFALDHSLQYGSRIEELLKRTRKKRRK